MTVRVTESEFARDIHGVLDSVEQGDEVIVEREDHRQLAIIKKPPLVGRNISECIARAKAYEEKLGYSPKPDPDFAKDVQDGIDSHREPMLNVWDE